MKTLTFLLAFCFGIIILGISPVMAAENTNQGGTTTQTTQSLPAIPAAEWRSLPTNWPKVTTFAYVQTHGVFPDSEAGLAACRQSLVDGKYQGTVVPGYNPTDPTHRRRVGQYQIVRTESDMCARTTTAIARGTVGIALIKSGTEVSPYAGTPLRLEMSFCGNPVEVLAFAPTRRLQQHTEVVVATAPVQVTVAPPPPVTETVTREVTVVTNTVYVYRDGSVTTRDERTPQQVVLPQTYVQVVAPRTQVVAQQVCQNGCWGGRVYPGQPTVQCRWPGADGRLGTPDDIIGCVPGVLCTGSSPNAEVRADFERARHASGGR
jgi:hypothetical protein